MQSERCCEFNKIYRYSDEAIFIVLNEACARCVLNRGTMNQDMRDRDSTNQDNMNRNIPQILQTATKFLGKTVIINLELLLNGMFALIKCDGSLNDSFVSNMNIMSIAHWTGRWLISCGKEKKSGITLKF
uniref:Uncharacterized protein n=1 Tax=Onchocerca volvulus TaxID=6282 RepID=A0A8R1Y3P6_ONCVO